MDNQKIFSAIDKIMAEKYPWEQKKDANGNVHYEFEVYADYRDEISDEEAAKILCAENPETAFYEKLYEWYQASFWQCEGDVKSKVIDKLNDSLFADSDEDADEYDDVIGDYLRDIMYVNPPADHFLKQEVYANIFVDTGDGNYDFVLNTRYPAWGGDDGAIPKEASIAWLAGTQGYTRGQLRKALNDGDLANPKGFLESMRQEMANAASHMNILVFLVKIPLERLMYLNELINKQAPTSWSKSGQAGPHNGYLGYVTLDKSVMCGLYDMWAGGGSVLEIELEKDVKVPIKYIRSALPDGSDGTYSIESVYGMCGSAWRDVVKEIHEPKRRKTA